MQVEVNERKYRVPEAAAALGLSAKTIWNKIGQGDIDVYRIGRSVRIGEGTLRKLLEDGFQPARRSAA
ncbi:MAG: helix-turn-helix domain-containing protein [Acidobacteriota bacterium]